MKLDVLIGLQWGDEGKGKIVDVLAPDYDIIARFQGGPNAGHTLEFDGHKHILHTIPSGVFHKNIINIIGNGVVIDPVIFLNEISYIHSNNIDVNKQLLISKRAHLIMPTHRIMDAALEQSKGSNKIGSTLKGIGPTYSDKISRSGLRVGDINYPSFKAKYECQKNSHLRLIKSLNFNYSQQLIDGLSFKDYEDKWFEDIEKINKMQLIDSEIYINEALNQGKKVLSEGAQGTMLDIDFGTYPYVTSSNTITAGVCTGLGVSPDKIGKVFGIVKAYCTRVGSGPFPTEQLNDIGQKLRDIGKEYGSTTGRPRRCGWLDLVALRFTIMLNNVTELFITKADVLNDFNTIKVCDEYEINKNITRNFPFNIDEEIINPKYLEYKGWQNLDDISIFEQIPSELADYIKFIELSTKVPVTIISIGADRKKILIKS